MILPHPTGHLAKAGDLFGCHHWGEGRDFWHLVGGDLGRRSTSCYPRDVPHSREGSVLDVSGAATGMETDQSRWSLWTSRGAARGSAQRRQLPRPAQCEGMDGLSVAMAAEARAVSSKGRGSPGWPPNKGTSVAGRAEAGRGGAGVRKVKSHRAL